MSSITQFSPTPSPLKAYVKEGAAEKALAKHREAQKLGSAAKYTLPYRPPWESKRIPVSKQNVAQPSFNAKENRFPSPENKGNMQNTGAAYYRPTTIMKEPIHLQRTTIWASSNGTTMIEEELHTQNTKTEYHKGKLIVENTQHTQNSRTSFNQNKHLIGKGWEEHTQKTKTEYDGRTTKVSDEEKRQNTKFGFDAHARKSMATAVENRVHIRSTKTSTDYNGHTSTETKEKKENARVDFDHEVATKTMRKQREILNTKATGYNGRMNTIQKEHYSWGSKEHSNGHNTTKEYTWNQAPKDGETNKEYTHVTPNSSPMKRVDDLRKFNLPESYLREQANPVVLSQKKEAERVLSGRNSSNDSRSELIPEDYINSSPETTVMGTAILSY